MPTLLKQFYAYRDLGKNNTNLYRRKCFSPRIHLALLLFMKLILVKTFDLTLNNTCHIYGYVFLNRVRITVTLISIIFPLFALLPFLSFSVWLFYLLFILMVISNLICIQITSPGGTPIRGKNARYRKHLFTLLSSSLPPLLHGLHPPPPVTSVCLHFQLSVLFTCSNTFSAFTT